MNKQDMSIEDLSKIPKQSTQSTQSASPNILAISIIFIGITITYLVAKYIMQSEATILGLCYIATVLAFQYFFNMWAMLSIHKDTSVSNGLMSLSFWITFIIDCAFSVNFGEVFFIDFFTDFFTDFFLEMDFLEFFTIEELPPF